MSPQAHYIGSDKKPFCCVGGSDGLDKCLSAMRVDWKNGAVARDRTVDLVINSHTLYRLSYNGLVSANERPI